MINQQIPLPPVNFLSPPTPKHVPPKKTLGIAGLGTMLAKDIAMHNTSTINLELERWVKNEIAALNQYCGDQLVSRHRFTFRISRKLAEFDELFEQWVGSGAQEDYRNTSASHKSMVVCSAHKIRKLGIAQLTESITAYKANHEIQDSHDWLEDLRHNIEALITENQESIKEPLAGVERGADTVELIEALPSEFVISAAFPILQNILGIYQSLTDEIAHALAVEVLRDALENLEKNKQ